MELNIPTQPIQPEVPVSQPVQEAPPKSNKTRTILIILVALVVLGIVGTSAYYLGVRDNIGNEKLAETEISPTITPEISKGMFIDCTADVKQCPDGSYVSRDPANNCEFSPCSTVDETANWKTYINKSYGYSIKYPTEWTVSQGRRLDAGASEQIKDLTIDVFNGTQKIMSILITSNVKAGNEDLAAFARDTVTPADMAAISNINAYKIGNYDGIKEFVSFKDPDLAAGIWYVTKDTKYFYTFVTPEITQSLQVKSLLATFKGV
ncbi:MAG: hypothetical protein A2W22_04370 [Candidatus Levybacteria bacterium RBG_16_35_11]|nr:MAG: hypothetical protein A2W22_04370 [Candidatus Levybacteria bacterium RBG_16_35_11]